MAATICLACGARPERAVVDEFFAESRLRDKTALQQTATVIFEPRVNGIVERFEITKVSTEEDNTKNVTVSAQVKLPDGSIGQKTIILILSHRTPAGVQEPAVAARWIVTGFIETPTAAAPRS